MNTSDLIICGNTTICDAMRIIDRSDYKILFIAEDGKLLGTLTDGDIRRYLFNGGSLQGHAEDAANRSPKVAHTFSQAAELYNRLYYIAIPIVDADGTIRDFYFGEEVPKAKKKAYRKLLKKKGQAKTVKIK